jgi:hypothetical protein
MYFAFRFPSVLSSLKEEVKYDKNEGVLLDITFLSKGKCGSIPWSQVSGKGDSRNVDITIVICSVCYLLHDGFLLRLLFNTGNVKKLFLRKVSWFSTDYTALCSRLQNWLFPHCFWYLNDHFVRNAKQMHCCKIWGFHGGDYDDYYLLGDDAVWLL